jgi:alpha-aminoadipate/glutamate carrier protein LysW
MSNTTCPVCDASVTLPEKAEESEIINCADCKSRLVIEKLSPSVVLQQAPAVEEDWGE